MNNEKIISALVGLAGAVQNGKKSDETDDVVINALARRVAMFDKAEEDEAAEKVRSEKFKVSPNCATCLSPCGNTSDYDFARFYGEPENIQKVKTQMFDELTQLAVNLSTVRSKGGKAPGLVDAKIPGCDFDEAMKTIYKAIACFSYCLKEESYIQLTEEIRTLRNSLD